VLFPRAGRRGSCDRNSDRRRRFASANGDRSRDDDRQKRREKKRSPGEIDSKSGAERSPDTIRGLNLSEDAGREVRARRSRACGAKERERVLEFDRCTAALGTPSPVGLEARALARVEIAVMKAREEVDGPARMRVESWVHGFFSEARRGTRIARS
jgi:hypothetical protein